MALNGYDESSFQGDINNALVPGDFDIIKATEGVGYTDADCDANFQQAKAAGKLLGVYHFARPDGNDPVSEANWFVSQVKGYIGEAVLILDLETDPTTPDWAKRWLDRVYELTGVRAWLYMNQARFNIGDWSAVWPNYAAWVASYGANLEQHGYGAPTAPVSVNGDWTIVAWQYTSKGILPGWGGDLDLNIAYLDAAAWHKYAAGDHGTVNTPEPAPQPAPAPVVAPEPTPTPAPATAAAPEPNPQPVAVETPTPTPTPTPTSTPSTPVAPAPDTEPASVPSQSPVPVVVQRSWVAVVIDFFLHLLRIRR